MTSQIALLGYLLWGSLFSFALVGVRYGLFFATGRKLNTFNLDGTDIGGLGQRITRAQGNILDIMAIPAGLLLYAIATGQTDVTDSLALLALAARMAQSITHLISTSHVAVLIRGQFLGAQHLIWLYWIASFLLAL